MLRKTWNSRAINALSWKTDQSAVHASSADSHEALKALTLPIICPLSPAPQLQTSVSLRSGGDSILLRPQRQKDIKYLSIDCVLACGCCRPCRVHRHRRPFLYHERDPSAPRRVFSAQASNGLLPSSHGEGGPCKASAQARGALQTWGPNSLFGVQPGLWLQIAFVRRTCHHSPSLWPLSSKRIRSN